MLAWHGADMLCYVTPKEHLGLPDAEDVRKGIVANKIAAHAADIARGRSGARERDDAMSRARHSFDWDEQFRLSLDPERARNFRNASQPCGTIPQTQEYCGMCGPKYCSMRRSAAIIQTVAEPSDTGLGSE